MLRAYLGRTLSAEWQFCLGRDCSSLPRLLRLVLLLDNAANVRGWVQPWNSDTHGEF